jgi:predicted lipid-binding transport protein (Tim44 family)
MPQKRPSMWKNVLGGALLGLGLGALFSHLGIGGAMASALSSILMIVLLALAVMFIVRMFRRKDTPANSNFPGNYSQPATASNTPEIGSGLNQPAATSRLRPAGLPDGRRPGRHLARQEQRPPPAMGRAGRLRRPESFLRHAKASFIRMQAAWDRSDLNDLREFTSPEVFAELQLQIQERGGKPDYTEVVSIDAQLLGIETTERDYLASVQFNGMIRNAPNAPAEPLRRGMEPGQAAVRQWRLGPGGHSADRLSYFRKKAVLPGFCLVNW